MRVLEKSGIPCWVAPRNIMPGHDWADAILKAITSSKLMVLIFSRHTAQSPHVRREIERAVHHGVPIAPLRVEDVLPDGALEYFLSAQHWADLFPGPVQDHVRDVLGRIQELLGVEPQRTPSPRSDPWGVDEAVSETINPKPPAQSAAAAVPASGRAWKWPAALIVLLALAVGGYLAWQFAGTRSGVVESTNAAKSQATPPRLPPK